MLFPINGLTGLNVFMVALVNVVGGLIVLIHTVCESVGEIIGLMLVSVGVPVVLH